nr:AAA family ATPase [uncultured Mucilaginibacter sp.]
MYESYFDNGAGFLPEDFIADIRANVAKNTDRLAKQRRDAAALAEAQKSKLLLVKTGDDWMRQEYGNPLPAKLFGDFWLEGELCILFADTNLGKSILAVQIGYNLAKGGVTVPFDNQVDGLARVLYVDFELSAKQFESRYSHPEWGPLHFGENFFRAEFNPEADTPAQCDDYDEYLAGQLEWAITQTKATVLIVDNITYMRAGTERAKDALPLMKQLKSLKTKHKLSMLVLAHTPKRNPFKPLTVNDLQGSKMLINLCDSAFAIGESQSTPGAKYLKQIKQRSGAQVYGEANVCVCHISKTMAGLHYEFDNYAHEDHHLQRQNRRYLQQQAQHLRAGGQSFGQISKQLGIPRSTIATWLGEAERPATANAD